MATWSFRNVFTQMSFSGAHAQIKYSVSGNICLQELIKLAVATVCFHRVENKSLAEVFDIRPAQMAPYLVPAVFYMVNNQCIFYAIQLVRLFPAVSRHRLTAVSIAQL